MVGFIRPRAPGGQTHTSEIPRPTDKPESKLTVWFKRAVQPRAKSNPPEVASPTQRNVSIGSPTRMRPRASESVAELHSEIKGYVRSMIFRLSVPENGREVDLELLGDAFGLPPDHDFSDTEIDATVMATLDQMAKDDPQKSIAFEDALAQDEVLASVRKSDVGRSLVRCVTALQQHSALVMQLHEATGALQAPRLSSAECVERLEMLANVLSSLDEMRRTTAIALDPDSDSRVMDVVERVVASMKERVGLLAPNQLCDIADAIRAVTTRIGDNRDATPARDLLQFAVAKSRAAYETATASMITALGAEPGESGAIETVSAAGRQLARHTRLLGTILARLPTEPSGEATLGTEHRAVDDAMHDGVRKALLRTGSQTARPPECFALLSAMGEGRRLLLRGADHRLASQSLAFGEIDAAHRLMSTLLSQWAPPENESEIIPDHDTLSGAWRTGLEQTFGLRLSERNEIQDLHRYSNTVFSNWDTYVAPVKSDFLKIAAKIRVQGVTPFDITGTNFHNDLSRTRFVIGNEVLDPRADRTGKVTADISAALSRVAGDDPGMGAHMAAWLHQGSMAFFINPYIPGLDRASLRRLSGVSGYESEMLSPMHVPWSANEGYTFVVDRVDRDRVRIEFRYTSRSDHAHRVEASERAQKLVTFDSGSNFWFSRYAVVLGPDGTALPDGPVEVHHTWRVGPENNALGAEE
ncbi:hypothetical protein ACNHE5_14410 [Pandoraea pnomenusa]|uniref:hypothetical protein n=1 Tax=Pandoraea pnomenusa TaxID=93220 RepID=UPI003CF20C36